MYFEESNRKVKIESAVLETIKKYIQYGDRNEAGGVLLGREERLSKNIIVDKLTTPGPCDERKRNSFFRKDAEHINCYEKLYYSSNMKYAYIGEWHTHHEEIPNYSKIDFDNWLIISKNDKSKNDHFHIIVGTKAIRIWKVSHKTNLAEFMVTWEWRDIDEELLDS